MSKKHVSTAIGIVVLALVLVGVGLHADEFTQQDVDRWQEEYMSVVQKGRALWGLSLIHISEPTRRH